VHTPCLCTQVERELARLEQLKQARMRELIVAARTKLTALWNAVQVPYCVHNIPRLHAAPACLD
jgi:hypothetical protein